MDTLNRTEEALAERVRVLEAENALLKARLKVPRGDLDAEKQRNNKLWGKNRAQKREIRRMNAKLRVVSLESQLREAMK